MTATFPYLIELVEDSARGLADVARRRMFGCDAYFTGEQIFVLLWKAGRIGVRLPDPAAHEKLLALDGAEPWQIGEKTMSHWVLVPEEFHDDAEALTPWIRQAHALARSGPTTAKPKPAKQPAAKQPAAKQPAAKQPARQPAAKQPAAKKPAPRGKGRAA
jgi:TfoX/Sxy family transcriptional regulator of competence genes